MCSSDLRHRLSFSAVDVLKDTDENYIRTLARLNSTIGINTDYVKRNSDRYTQQKMTVGAYREEVKAALIDLQNGNKSMQNMGIIAKNAGMMLKTELAPGLNQVHVGMKGLVSVYVGGQAVVSGVLLCSLNLERELVLLSNLSLQIVG